LERVGRHGSKFDPEKAKWFNHQYMQLKSDEELTLLLKPSLEEHGVSPAMEYQLKVIHLMRERAFLVPDLWNSSWFFFTRPAQYDAQVYQKIWLPGTTGWIRDFSVEVEKMDEFNKDTLHTLVEKYTKDTGVKMGQLMNPLRLLMVGTNQGPGIMDMADVLGKSEFLTRIDLGLQNII
jgi:glutamyl-tRNA synthetase